MDYLAFKAEIEDVKKELKEIKDAIIGNALMGDGGIKQMLKNGSERMTKLEERVVGLERKANNARYFFMGISAVAATATTIIISVVKYFINK